MHQLALHARQVGAVLEVGAHPVRCLPGDHLFHKPGPTIGTDLHGCLEHHLRQLMPLTGSKGAYLLGEPGRGRICEADQGLKPKYIAIIADLRLTQDLKGALSLAGVYDATGPGHDHRFL